MTQTMTCECDKFRTIDHISVDDNAIRAVHEVILVLGWRVDVLGVVRTDLHVLWCMVLHSTSTSPSLEHYALECWQLTRQLSDTSS